MQNVTLEISGMSCGHCVSAVQAALKSVPGVAGGTVVVGSADVAVDPTSAPVDQIAASAVRAIQDAGYDARVTSGARAAEARPTSRGLPVSGSCCGPRSA